MEEDSTLITREWLYTKVELLDQNSRKDLIADVSDPGCESEEVLREAVRTGAGGEYRGGQDHGLQTAPAGEVKLQEAELVEVEDDLKLHDPEQETEHGVAPGPVPAQHLLPAGGQPRHLQLQAAERQQLAARGCGRP